MRLVYLLNMLSSLNKDIIIIIIIIINILNPEYACKIPMSRRQMSLLSSPQTSALKDFSLMSPVSFLTS